MDSLGKQRYLKLVGQNRGPANTKDYTLFAGAISTSATPGSWHHIGPPINFG
jgi:hypothetical protein